MDNDGKAVLKNILSRRTVREYRIEGIKKSVMKTIIKAGDCAPSAGGLISRRFVTITKKADIDFILRHIYSKAVRIHQKGFFNVPLLIIMCANVKRCSKYYRRGKLYAIQDATMAGQNMALIAHSLGIGSCWVGQFHQKKIKDRFDISEGYEIVGIMAFGHPLKQKESRYEPHAGK